MRVTPDYLTVASRRVFCPPSHSYDLEQEEAQVAEGASNSRDVTFRVSSQRFPAEFAKLARVQQQFQLADDGTYSSVATSPELIFNIDAPAASKYYNSYFTEVQAVLSPFNPNAPADEKVDVRIVKDSGSLILREDGLRKNGVSFQHVQIPVNFDYTVRDCKAASSVASEDLQGNAIRYSPYGQWRVQVQAQHIADKAALSAVTDIEFRFKLTQKTVNSAQTGLTMFANDPVPSSSGVNPVRPGCPVPLPRVPLERVTVSPDVVVPANGSIDEIVTKLQEQGVTRTEADVRRCDKDKDGKLSENEEQAFRDGTCIPLNPALKELRELADGLEGEITALRARIGNLNAKNSRTAQEEEELNAKTAELLGIEAEKADIDSRIAEQEALASGTASAESKKSNTAVTVVIVREFSLSALPSARCMLAARLFFTPAFFSRGVEYATSKRPS